MATLANLGNTCFLNSVLYTLRYVQNYNASSYITIPYLVSCVRFKYTDYFYRFAPQFMHQLHHVIVELSSLKPTSSNSMTRPERTQLAMERLHELYQALRGIEESKDMSFEPIQPSVFFSAFRYVFLSLTCPCSQFYITYIFAER
jgi:hypothetical protein